MTAGQKAEIPVQRAYTARQVSQMIAVPYEGVLALCISGDLFSRRAGRRYVIPAWAVDEFLAKPDTT